MSLPRTVPALDKLGTLELGIITLILGAKLNENLNTYEIEKLNHPARIT